MVAGEQGVASLNQMGAARGHNFGVGEQLDNYARPEGRQRGVGLLGKGQPAPPHQLGGLGSAVIMLPQLGSGRPPAANGFSCYHQIASHLSFYTCKLQLCVELFMPI